MTSAHPLPVRSTPRLAVAALALISSWTLYTIPAARARAEAALRPLVAAAWPAGPQIRIGEVHARRGEWNGQTVLYVEGSVVNAGAGRLKAPALRLALIGDDGRAIYMWKAKPAKTELEAAGEATFQTRLLAPPETFRSIEVRADEG